MRVALQPASTTDATVVQHYRDTIETPVRFAEHLDLLTAADYGRLNELFPHGSARLWGVTPGKGDVNLSRIRKLTAGDFVMFYADGAFYLAGTIALLFHNEELAARLWGWDEKQQTWEYMYALTSARAVHVPIAEMRPILGWGPRSVVQGIQVIEHDKAAAIAELAGLDPADQLLAATGGADPRALRESTRTYAGPLERQALRAQRGEQRQLKQHLVHLAGSTCALCGRNLPPQFLVAAHIKRRSECTDDEKVDFDNVAMLACLLGCDSLYEHGYICVEPGGSIRISDQVALSSYVEQHCHDHLAGRTTGWWQPEREPYFEWHRTHRFRAEVRPATPVVATGRHGSLSRAPALPEGA